MDSEPMNATLDRLFRHMAWANAQIHHHLLEIPEDSYALYSDNEEWTVGTILEHLVRAAGNYAAHLDGQPRPEGITVPSTKADIENLATLCAGFDARLRKTSLLPDAVTSRERDGKTITRNRSTVVAQSIHHSIEHRAQIAGILAMHGIKAIDLDAIDVWGLGDAEGLNQ
jgi:uncharacterized damage-inducible protein DinB